MTIGCSNQISITVKILKLILNDKIEDDVKIDLVNNTLVERHHVSISSLFNKMTLAERGEFLRLKAIYKSLQWYTRSKLKNNTQQACPENIKATFTIIKRNKPSHKSSQGIYQNDV